MTEDKLISVGQGFAHLCNKVETPKCVEIAVDTMTEEWDPESYVEESAEPRFKTVSVEIGELGINGASKALFIKLMMGLVQVGHPALLRVGWVEPPCLCEIEGKPAVACELGVVDKPAFLEDWEGNITNIDTLMAAIRATGIEDNGETRIWLPGMPVPKEHKWATPWFIWSLRALYVSIMCQIYDHGDPAKLELHWRYLPSVEHKLVSATKRHFMATAGLTVTPRQRIVAANH